MPTGRETFCVRYTSVRRGSPVPVVSMTDSLSFSVWSSSVLILECRALCPGAYGASRRDDKGERARQPVYQWGSDAHPRWFHREFGDAARAVEYDRESLELWHASGVANVEMNALANLGLDYLALGQYTRALSYLAPTLERVEHGSCFWHPEMAVEDTSAHGTNRTVVAQKRI